MLDRVNAPTHILSGLVLAQAALAVAEANRGTPLPATARAAVALAVFPLAALAHLILDAMPHWFWVGSVGGPAGWRHEWFVRSALAGSLMLLPFALWCRRGWAVSLAGAAGAVFPDLEKAAYFLGRWPAARVVFDHHSLRISNHTGGLPSWALVAVEVTLLLLMLSALRGLCLHRAEARQAHTIEIPPA